MSTPEQTTAAAVGRPPTARRHERLLPPRRGLFVTFLRNLARTRMAIPALAVLIVLVFCAIFAAPLAPFDPVTDQIYAEANQGPSAKHWLGTDYLGRDIFSRLLFGARVSLSVGIISVGIALLVGTLVGLASGYFGGVAEALLMRCIDAISAFPALILTLAITSALGRGIVNAMIAIGIVSIPAFARLARAATLSVRESDYVMAGRALGASNARIIARYVLPNIAAPLIVQSSLLFAGAIATEAGLSFLGVGVQPPRPSWGVDLQFGYQYMEINPILAFAPGGAIFITVLACNFFGDALRVALDPRLSRRG
jgi:peptide/nickel transport system permease protein